MRMALGVPVLNKPEMTARFIEHLNATVVDPTSLVVVILDNASEPAYHLSQIPETPFPCYIVRLDVNQGYYTPLRTLAEMWDYEILTLAHNDILIYEQGWDRRLRECFVNDPKLGVVGFCGSSQVDDQGGRGSGTMMNFRGTPGLGQQQAGIVVKNLTPAAILDSLFMAFRREVAVKLLEGEEPTPAHFYDKIWPMRALQWGWHVGVLGVEIDHLGGTTLVAEPAFWHDMVRWCREQGIVAENPTLAVYLEAERRWLHEFRAASRVMPGGVGDDWKFRTTS